MISTFGSTTLRVPARGRITRVWGSTPLDLASRAGNAKSNPLAAPRRDLVGQRATRDFDSSWNSRSDAYRKRFFFIGADQSPSNHLCFSSLAYKRSVDLFGLWLLDGPRQAWNAALATGTAAAGGTGGLGDGHAGCAVRSSGRRMGYCRAHSVALRDEQQQDRQPLCGYFPCSQQ